MRDNDRKPIGIITALSIRIEGFESTYTTIIRIVTATSIYAVAVTAFNQTGRACATAFILRRILRVLFTSHSLFS